MFTTTDQILPLFKPYGFDLNEMCSTYIGLALNVLLMSHDAYFCWCPHPADFHDRHRAWFDLTAWRHNAVNFNRIECNVCMYFLLEILYNHLDELRAKPNESNYHFHIYDGTFIRRNLATDSFTMPFYDVPSNVTAATFGVLQLFLWENTKPRGKNTNFVAQAHSMCTDCMFSILKCERIEQVWILPRINKHRDLAAVFQTPMCAPGMAPAGAACFAEALEAEDREERAERDRLEERDDLEEDRDLRDLGADARRRLQNPLLSGSIQVTIFLMVIPTKTVLRLIHIRTDALASWHSLQLPWPETAP